MEETAKLIKLIVDKDMEGLYTLEKQTTETMVTLNNILKNLRITLSTLEECELQECEEFELIDNRCADYSEKLQDSTKFLFKVRKAIASLEESNNC